MLPLHRYLAFLRATIRRPAFLALWCGAALGVLVFVALTIRWRSIVTVTVDRVTFEEQGDNLVVHARVTNGMRHRVYVYDKRALDHHFDEGSGTLTAVMHTIPFRPTGSSADCHVMLPSFRAIEPRESVTLELKLPAHSKTIVYGAQAKENPVPSHVRLELGWSDEPLTLHDDEHSLCTYAAGTRLEARERGIAIQTSR